VGAEPLATVPNAGVRSRLVAVRARVRRVPGGALLWRIGITVAGILVIAVGVVLLPLPGPGWLIIFAGLGLLATEYTWAARVLSRSRGLVVRWTRWAAQQHLAVRLTLIVTTVAVVGALVLGAWWLYSVR
jgi:uncharacterized protein (TIGR02611 family)